MAGRCRVREAAIVDRTARPSAPPTCCEVLKSPEASPASSPATFVVASSVIGTNVRPMPIEVTPIAGSNWPR